ncbi:MAG TPA: hypothetical protein QGF05_15365 [Dehalococcoidia bacterium]|nr:hypothetical protein [Dehalococcoidia bacterium]
MSTSPTPPRSDPASPEAAPDRGSQFADGLKSVGKALWFFVSMLLYAIGLVFLTIGKAFIKLSGWGRDNPSDSSTDPSKPASSS